jgi:hypothetical protein
MSSLHRQTIFLNGKWYCAKAIKANETGGTLNQCIFVGISWYELHEIKIPAEKETKFTAAQETITSILNKCKV